MKTVKASVEQHFEGRHPVVRAIYDRLLAAARRLGEVEEDPKQTSIHWNRVSAFAGVATRKEGLILTLKSTQDMKSPRIRKHEKASARRWYLYIPLAAPSDVDAELKAWMKASYEISG